MWKVVLFFIAVAGLEFLNRFPRQGNTSISQALIGSDDEVEQSRVDVHDRTIPMERLLACLQGLLLKPLCRLYRRDDVIAWDEAQRHQIRRYRIAADRNESDDVAQFLLMMEVVAKAFECRKFPDVEEIGSRSKLRRSLRLCAASRSENRVSRLGETQCA